MIGVNISKANFTIEVHDTIIEFTEKYNLEVADFEQVVGVSNGFVRGIRAHKSTSLHSALKVLLPMGYTIKVVKVDQPIDAFKVIKKKRKKIITKKNAEYRRKYRKRHGAGVFGREQDHLPTTF